MASTKRARTTRGAEQSTFSLKPAALAVAVALSLGGGGRPALANPTAPTVVNGQVTINQAGNLLSITNSPNSIINWQSFSIGAGEITRFTQQSAASAILNRVVGAGGSIDPSVILGALQSNGRVFLLNPSGIVFGAGSQIDVAGLVASSLNLSNADFLGGRLRFTEVPGAGAVVNQGAINAASGGQVYLVGPSVTNSGIITSPKGEVILAAGNSVELVNPGTPNLRVEITAPENEARNLGSIVAEAGRVGIYAGLINHSGTIRADKAVATDDGRIILKATKDVTLGAGSVTTANGPAGGRIEINAGDTALVAGTVEAKGASGQGGIVHVLGDKVGIYGNAHVDVSGETGGGTVLVGGEYQGKPGVTAVEGAAIRNATSTFFGTDASISADAIASGDGGKVILWSDDTARSYGAISARGGAASGNGGFVETSGKMSLDVTRGPDLRAPSGLAGTWLLDPIDFEVVAGTVVTNNTAQPLFSPLADSSKIGVDLINLQLNFGSNVILTTASQGPGNGSQPGNIMISAPILKTASTTTGPGGMIIGTTSLTVQAHNNIVLNPGGSIVSTGDRLDVTLAANFFNPGTGMGGVIVNDAILTNGGALSISGRGPVDVNAPVSTVRTIGTGSGGFVSLSSFAGTVNVANTVVSGSSFAASGATGVALNGAVTTPNNANINLFSSGGMVAVNAPVAGRALTAEGFAGVSVNAPVNVVNTVSLYSDTGPVAVNAAVTGGFFDAEAFGMGSLLTIAAPVTSTGAFLVADNMNILAQVDGGTGGITVLPATFGWPVNLGGEMASTLSLTQPELSNFVTSGSATYGNGFGTGAFSVSAPVVVGSSSVAMNSNTSFTVSPGASVTSGSPLTVTAPSVTIGGPVSASDVTFNSVGTMAVNASVQAPAGTINVNSSTHVNLGDGAGGGLHLDAAELANLSAPTLRISSNGTMMVQGPVTRAGTLSLSGTALTQAAGGTLAVPDLDLFSFDSVDLPQDNDVDRLAGFASGTFNFVQKPSKLLTIAPVGFSSGVQSSSGPINLTSDMFDVAGGSFVFAFGDSAAISIMPRSAGVRLDLGGADGMNVLGISQPDLDGIFASQVMLKADVADISSQVAFFSDVLAIAPLTSGLALNIQSSKTAMPTPGVTPLEFVPGELNLVSGNSFVLGDATVTGPVNVGAAVDLTTGPGSVGLFTLRTGNPAGIVVNAPVRASSLGFTANQLALNADVTAANGDLFVVPNTAGTQIDLGGGFGPGPMLISQGEAARLFAPNGTLFIGNSLAGDIFMSDDITFLPGQIANLNVTSGSMITVGNDGWPLAAPGPIFLTAPAIEIVDDLTSTGGGSINLAANALTVSAQVVSNGGDINIRPQTAGTDITLGGAGGLSISDATLDQLDPGSGRLRIGDLDGITRSIAVNGAISPANATALSLLTSHNGSVTQTASGIITVPNLAVRARNVVTLTADNLAPTVSLQSDDSNVSYTYAGTSPAALTVGDVDPSFVTGGVNAGGDVTLRTNEIVISNGIGGSTVKLAPRPVAAGPANTATLVGTGAKPGGTLGITQDEFDRISALAVVIGDSANTGDVAVTGAMTVNTFSNLTIETQPGSLVTVGAPLNVPFGNFTVTAGSTITTSAAVSAGNNITMVADAMIFGAPVIANPSFGIISLEPRSGTAVIDIGGNDNVSTFNTLGLDGTDTGHLSAATLRFGFNSPPTITVSAMTNFGSKHLEFTTALAGTVNVSNALTTAGNVTFNTDNFAVSGSVSGANVTVSSVNTGLAVDLAPLASSLNSISTTPTGTLMLNVGTLNVGSPVTLSTPANVALRADTMNIGNPVTMSGAGGVLSVSRRTNNIMRLGTDAGGGLTDAEIDQFTAPVLRLGDTSTASQLSIDGAISINPLNVGALTLSSGFSGISQGAAGSGFTITAQNLRLNSNGQINLSEPNVVGTLAGGNTGSTFDFTSTGALAVGSVVDGVSGLQGGSLTLKADDFVIAGPGTISNSTSTLAPRNAASAIILGSSPGGVFGVDGGELAQITGGGLLTFGTNTGGPVTVSAPMQRATGQLGIITAPTQTVDVGGELSAPSGVQVDAGTINVSQPISSASGSVTLTARAPATLNVNAPITAGSNVALNSDATNINATVTANQSFGTVTIAPIAPVAPATAMRPVSLGVETSGALSLTQAELALINAPNLTLGSTTAGPMTVSAPLDLSVNALNLRSGSSIVQDPAAPIRLTKLSSGTNPQRIGNLDVRSSGAGNGTAPIFMPAANEVPGSLTFDTAGTNNDFDFVNALPMKVQSVGNLGVSGKVRLNSALFIPVPIEIVPLVPDTLPDFNAQLLAGIDKIADINDALDEAGAEDRKKAEDEKKRQQECR